jgi:hypothetical protein
MTVLTTNEPSLDEGCLGRESRVYSCAARPSGREPCTVDCRLQARALIPCYPGKVPAAVRTSRSGSKWRLTAVCASSRETARSFSG